MGRNDGNSSSTSIHDETDSKMERGINGKSKNKHNGELVNNSNGNQPKEIKPKDGTMSAAASLPSISATSVTEKPIDAIQLIKKGTKLQVIKGVINDYSNATSIHGIKYFGGNDKAWYVRLLWLIILSVSIYFCVRLTLETWTNWRNNPVIVSLAESSTDIWSIPFPAITICPMVKYSKEFEDEYDKLFENSVDNKIEVFKKDYNKFRAVSHICKVEADYMKDFKIKNDSDSTETPVEMLTVTETTTSDEQSTSSMSTTGETIYPFDEEEDRITRGDLGQFPTTTTESYDYYENAEILNNFQKLSDPMALTVPIKSIRDNLKEISPQIEETIKKMTWRKDNLDGFANMKEILTSDGLCFSFNAFDNSEIFRTYVERDNIPYRNISWSLDNGYPAGTGTKAYPRRVIAGDVDESFHVMLKSRNMDQSSVCAVKSKGYKVILHTPGEFPQVTKRFFRVPFKQLISVAVKPNMITTTAEVQEYSPAIRRCYFNKERYLQFFKTYTQGNCEHECLANYTFYKCKCYHFSIPKAEGTRYCEITEKHCYKAARRELLKQDGYKSNTCDCLPSCTSIAYDTEVTQSILNIPAVDDEIIDEEEEKKFKLSTMNVFFASDQFLSAKRSELYQLADLIANIGGLFGLFMGVSILSLVEIIYFCTVRMYVNIKMRVENKKKKMSENLT